MSTKNYIGYGDYYSLSTTIAANTSYNLYAKMYENTQIVTINDNTVYNGTISGEINTGYNMTLFAANWEGTVKYFANTKIRSCKILENGTLVRDYVPCTNSSGTVGLYDLVNSEFYTNAGTGTFTAGSTVLSVARRIKKAYIGIGGIARPWFTGGELAYYGKATNLSAARYWFDATTVGDYALFGGGSTGSDSAVVDAYTKSLTRSTPTVLSLARYGLTAVTVGDYGLFCGGIYSGTSGTSVTGTVDAYDKSLTRSSPTWIGFTSYELTSVAIGEYAIIAGGSNFTKSLSAVTAYDKSLTRLTSVTHLSYITQNFAAVKVGGYALFAGGYYEDGSGNYGYRNIVTVYNESLTKSSASNLSVSRCNLAGAVIGRYAIFAGGDSASYTYASNVDTYDISLTHTTLDDLPLGRRYLGAATLGDYAIFGPGQGYTDGDVDIYDGSLVRTSGTNFSANNYKYSTTVVGDYALFGGGYVNGGRAAIVEVYTIK